MKHNHARFLLFPLLAINSLATPTIFAEPIYHPSGPKLTFGGMTHRQSVSGMGNPAHPVTIPYPKGDKSLYGGGVSVGVGIEYAGADNLFKLIDKVAGGSSTVSGGDDGSGESGESGEAIIPTLPSIGGKLDPEVVAELEGLVVEIASAAALVALAVSNVNAKVFGTVDIPVLISNNTLGGAWAFNINSSVTTNLRGVNDPIDLNAELATKNLIAAYESLTTDQDYEPLTSKTFDLSGGASVTIDPSGATRFRFDNDSSVITRAAHMTEVGIGYSRKIWHKENNNVYFGVKPKYLNVGLSNTPIQISDLEGAKDIFDKLKKKNFKYKQGFALDLGVIWSGKQYQVGATLANINEPDFNYPAADLSNFNNPIIIKLIRDSENFTVERQLKFDAGYVTSDGAWGVNFGFDANAVPDPMGDDYQWLSVGTGFASDSWWLPGGRLGMRKNLAGTELTYITAGLSFFNFLNLDVAVTTDTIKISGQEVPVGAYANLSMIAMF